MKLCLVYCVGQKFPDEQLTVIGHNDQPGHEDYSSNSMEVTESEHLGTTEDMTYQVCGNNVIHCTKYHSWLIF